jgi:hypothetical protein
MFESGAFPGMCEYGFCVRILQGFQQKSLQVQLGFAAAWLFMLLLLLPRGCASCPTLLLLLLPTVTAALSAISPCCK